MAFFKFRKGGDDQTAAAAPAESVEALRKRAKHRLIGTAILVLLAVVGFPLLVDKQPRPIAINIPIDIPDKDTVKPLASPPAVTPAPVASATLPSASASGRVGNIATPVEPKPAAKPADKVVEKAPDKALAKVAATTKERFVVQIGAFSDTSRVDEVRRKLKRAGVETFTQEVVTKDGRRSIRVRVGTFDSRAQADKAAEKIKKLDLPAAVLTL